MRRKPPLGPPRSESGGLEAPLQQLSPRLAALKSAKEQCATQECHGRTFALLQAVQGLSEQAESSTTNTGVCPVQLCNACHCSLGMVSI